MTKLHPFPSSSLMPHPILSFYIHHQPSVQEEQKGPSVSGTEISLYIITYEVCYFGCVLFVYSLKNWMLRTKKRKNRCSKGLCPCAPGPPAWQRTPHPSCHLTFLIQCEGGSLKTEAPSYPYLCFAHSTHVPETSKVLIK